MSDLSTLSHEYATNALFADEINTLILKLKKNFLKTAGLAAVSDNEIQEAQKRLMDILEEILAELKPKIYQPDIVKKEIGLVPIEVIERILYQYRNTLDYFIEDVKDIIERLKSNKQINSKGFELLDSLCDAADSITSTSFRRLWRR
jgi:hypothetical protein